MAPAFSKEAILQGAVDHLCLVCESYLRTDREVCQHVTTPAHHQNLENTDYVKKYRLNRIRKVKKWYLCEFCNTLVSTIRAVGLHVKEPRHVENKSSQIIARVDDVIVSGNIVIQEEAWHGFIDENTCTICNEEYEDKDVHKSEFTHVINLVQSKAIAVKNNVYRKIDDNTFHCLTCNEIVPEITKHLDEIKHKNVLQKCIRKTPHTREPDVKITNVQDTTNQNLKTKVNTKCTEDDYNKHTADILDSITKFQQNNININVESCTAVCRKCSSNLEYNSKYIENHIEEHKNDAQRKFTGSKPTLLKTDETNKARDSGTMFTSPVFRTAHKGSEEKVETKPTETTERNANDSEIKEVAERYGLTYISVDDKVHCQKCNKDIPSSVGKIIGHVNGELHISRNSIDFKDTNISNEINAKICNYPQISFYDFVNAADRIKNTMIEDVVLNDKYCIDIFSFFLFKMTIPGLLRCQVCELNLPFKDLEEHIDAAKHKRAMFEVPVLIREDLEFLREIRSGIYQCGYCNISDTWDGMENHLKSTDHKASKTFADYRLSEHLPEIAQWRLERRVNHEFLKLWLS